MDGVSAAGYVGAGKPDNSDGDATVAVSLEDAAASRFELPMEPLPARVVRREELARPALQPAFDELYGPTSAEVTESEWVESEPERDEAGTSTLRPVVPIPAPVPAEAEAKPTADASAKAISGGPSGKRVGSPTRGVRDERHPVRAAFALLTLITFAAIALTIMIGAAIAAIAIVLRSAA